MLDKVVALLNKEIKEENEPKETAVLIRVLCLIDVIFLTVNAILCFAKYGPIAGIKVSLIACLMVLTFVASYMMKMSPLIYLYYFMITINVVVLTVLFGLSYMFQAQMFVVFEVFFYRGAGDKNERVASVFMSALVALGLFLYVGSHGGVYPEAKFMQSASTCFCTLYVISKSAAIAYFFRLKFSASEEKILKYSKKLERLATTDPLTKLQNRRGMINHIEELVSGSQTAGNMLTVAIGDIDFFKHINDTYGHDAGDYVLETIAKIMNEFMESKGMVARWGGEEFLFSFENINGDYAFEEMSKLLHLIERYEFSFNGTPIKVTMTFGLEEYDDNLGVDKVISKADEKLYMGKEQGRNRVIY
ncbi:MAG: GGDEF domain-containing protein [Lachnospiraceae bacterium]|nr:GGDEF domain-containing protein [Lachnospiraceae bacterium]